MSKTGNIEGVGLGLRWQFLDELLNRLSDGAAPIVPFFEVSPENYMRRGGFMSAAIDRVGERYSLLTHGLTMGVGGLDPFDDAYFAELRRFTSRVEAPYHSDHLCFGGVGGVLHDLLPLPLTRASSEHVSARIREATARLERPFAVENISRYIALGEPSLSEAAFIGDVLEKSGASLLLDVNNAWVNAANDGTDPLELLGALPLERVVALHVAGHEHRPEDDVILDTHGAPVIEPVLDLLSWVVERTGPLPVVLERDHNVPALDELLRELASVQTAYERGLARHASRIAPKSRSPELGAPEPNRASDAHLSRRA